MIEKEIAEEVEINYLKQEQEIEQEILLAQLSESQVISENKRIKRLLDVVVFVCSCCNLMNCPGFMYPGVYP